MVTKLIKAILALQPLFPVSIYFSVLIGHPPVWLSLIIAIIPICIRYWHTQHVFVKTPFDLPILIFMCGTLIGFAISADKSVSAGALSSTFASILVYYGITSNSGAPRKYWLWTAGIICLITLLLSLWFLSQGNHRDLSFNQWAFNLFVGLPKTVGPVLQWNTIGALLAVVIPPLFTLAFFKHYINLQIISFMLLLFFTGTLFLSDSGAGWLAFAVSMAIIILCWRRWLIWVLVPAGGTLIGVAILSYDKTKWLRTTFSTNSLGGRIKLCINTLLLLKGKTSIFGLGLGTWLNVYDNHYSNTTAIVPYLAIVHNSYLQLFCDSGMFGLIAMVLAAIIFIRLSFNLIKSSCQNTINWVAIGLIGSISAGAVFAMFDVTTSVTYVTGPSSYIYLVLPLLWIAAGLFSVASNRFSTLN